MITYNKIRYFKAVLDRITQKAKLPYEQQVINFTKDELMAIAEAMERYIPDLGDTLGDEQYHEMVDRGGI